MATLRVIRDSGYADLVRAYSVKLDGKEIGTIKNGETKDFQVSSGNHELQIKIDWAGSKALAFVANESESSVFRVASNLRGLRLFLALWYVIFDSSSYLVLEPDRSTLPNRSR